MKQIKIYEFNKKNYLKSGRLSKRATPDLSLTISDHLDGKDHSKEDTAYLADWVMKAMPDITKIESPYIFTHIKLWRGAKLFILYEDVTVNGHRFITSPTELLKALKSPV